VFEPDLLGRHVAELALELTAFAAVRAIGGLGDAEIHHTRHALDGDQDVLGRDIAMHDAERLARLAHCLVRSVQAQ
jgi:hypothetical protein